MFDAEVEDDCALKQHVNFHLDNSVRMVNPRVKSLVGCRVYEPIPISGTLELQHRRHSSRHLTVLQKTLFDFCTIESRYRSDL